MNNAKLNTKIRRFFDRLGGGGVKALKIKDNTGFGNNGGGSEDAQKLFEMFFGQMPYVYPVGGPPMVEPMPITEYSIAELLELYDEYSNIALIYKKREPIVAAREIKGEDAYSISVVAFSELEMVPVPADIPNGPWYYPDTKVDIDLSNFSVPTEGNCTILTGIEILQKEELIVRQKNYGNITYHWDSDRYSAELSDGLYVIVYDEDSWIWNFFGRIS